MTSDKVLGSLDEIGKGVAADVLPEAEAMIRKGLEILSKSPVSSPLVDMVGRENIKIRVVRAKREASYVPRASEVYIGVTACNPTHPARFILLLADALLEARMELEGMEQPSLKEPKEKYVSKTAERKAKKIAELCSIAFDLDQKEEFKAFKFMNEMQAMGHDKAIDVFIGNL